MAERAGIGRMTLVRIERGDPAVSVGAFARVLFVLGLTTRLEELADVRHDPTGLALEEERLPQRIRTARKPGKSQYWLARTSRRSLISSPRELKERSSIGSEKKRERTAESYS